MGAQMDKLLKLCCLLRTPVIKFQNMDIA